MQLCAIFTSYTEQFAEKKIFLDVGSIKKNYFSYKRKHFAIFQVELITVITKQSVVLQIC